MPFAILATNTLRHCFLNSDYHGNTLSLAWMSYSTAKMRSPTIGGGRAMEQRASETSLNELEWKRLEFRMTNWSNAPESCAGGHQIRPLFA